MNSSYGNDPKILKAMGPATVVIHPDDAAARGIGEGDAVRLSAHDIRAVNPSNGFVKLT